MVGFHILIATRQLPYIKLLFHRKCDEVGCYVIESSIPLHFTLSVIIDSWTRFKRENSMCIRC